MKSIVAPAAVVDASAFYSLIANGPAAAALRDRIAKVTLHAPAVVDLEVVNALRKNVLSGLPPDRADAAIDAYRSLPIERYPHDDFIDRIWQLRANLTAYDAVYVALAETLNAPLITLDARLASAAPPTVRVELFE